MMKLAMMMKLRELSTASLSLFFLLSGFVLVHAQAPAAPIEPPPALSAIVHDFTRWLDHIGLTGADHHRVNSHSPPLPRPRPPERASAPVASNKELSEFAPAPVPSKKKTITPVQIND
jgi:hypothetical protein